MTIRWTETLTSGAFRFALMVGAVFALGSLALLAVVDRSMAHYADEATRGSLTAETNGLIDDDRASGRSALLRALAQRQAGSDPQYHYAILDQRGRRLTGDLLVLSPGLGFGRLQAEADASAGEPDSMPALTTRLNDGMLLVVATDSYDIDDLRSRLDRVTLGGGAVVTLLALLGGYFVGGRFLRRLDNVNHAVARIVDGNLHERLPAIGMSREFDTLSRNLNTMLDRIGVLMDAMRQVSTDIAHDLRTPLTRLRQQLETAQELEPAGPHTAVIAAALRQTDDLLRIFRALLRIGTLEGGIGRSRFARVDLSEAVTRVVEAYQPVAEDGGRQLAADIAPDIVVIGDGELLIQLFTNLVENALTHTPPGSHVHVALGTVDGVPVVTVADNGPGIPIHERANVVRRFYRLDASRGSPGSGLGLALVAAIATLHRATLSFGNSDPGLRVTISFALPT